MASKIDAEVDKMIENGDSMSDMYDAVLENVKSRICDGYCKYPAEYSVKDNDLNYDRLVDDVCSSCPLNIL